MANEDFDGAGGNDKKMMMMMEKPEKPKPPVWEGNDEDEIAQQDAFYSCKSGGSGALKGCSGGGTDSKSGLWSEPSSQALGGQQKKKRFKRGVTASVTGGGWNGSASYSAVGCGGASSSSNNSSGRSSGNSTEFRLGAIDDDIKKRMVDRYFITKTKADIDARGLTPRSQLV
jgi:hypothetical protein